MAIPIRKQKTKRPRIRPMRLRGHFVLSDSLYYVDTLTVSKRKHRTDMDEQANQYGVSFLLGLKICIMRN